MLFRKMLREFRSNFGLFFSVFLLSGLAVGLFITMEGHVLSQNVARAVYHEECNLSDLWMYGEGFSQDNLDAVRKLDFVEAAQLRTSVTGTTPDIAGVQVDIYIMSENVVNKPYLIEGEEFNPADKDGIWLANAFAKRRDLEVGDTFQIEYKGVKIKRTIKGLVESAEYEYRQADGDADMYLENIAIVFLSYDSVPYTQMVIKTKDGGGLIHEDELAEAVGHKYSAIIDRDSVPGLARLDSELEQHMSFSYLFVVIFVGIAVLVIATSMGRIVEKQRTQIGTMNALGMKRWKIMLHYISYSLSVSLLGVIVGMFVGVRWGAPAMINLFSQYYIVPGLKSVFHPLYVVIACLIVIICSLSCMLSCRKVLVIQPAEALRPAAPKQGRKCIFEKLPFWGKLSFNAQYNLRDISRAKLRACMCVIGTCVGMLLMVYGVGCATLLDDMIDISFNRTNAAKYQVKLSADADTKELDRLADESDGELVAVEAIEIAKVKNALSADKKKESLTVIEGNGLYNLLDVNNDVMKLEPGAVAVSRRLAEDMDIAIGDVVYWHLYSANEWYEAKVGSIYRSNESQGIAYLRSDYEKTGAKYSPAYLYTDSDLAKDYETLSCVSGVLGKDEMIAAYETSMEIINVLVYFMIIASSILIVVVLYNSGTLSFNERIKELATLKVMGLQSSQIRRLLSVQNLWLSIIGIIIGIPFGNMSLNAMINSNGDNFDYSLSLPWYDYVIAGVLVLAVSMLVSLMFSGRIKKLDLVETLKGVE